MNLLLKKGFILEKKPHKEFLVKYSLEKSREAIKEVQILLDNNLLNTAESKLYYSIYYAVSALAYLEGFKTSKHAQLRGWFNKNYIHERKIFSPDFFKLYKTAYEDRKNADYEFTYKALKENIEDNLNRTIDFIDEIENYINLKNNL